MISIRGIDFAYPEQLVLSAFDLEVRTGEVVAIMGPSGCGKSTLIRLVAGFVKASRGDILINGRPVREYTRDRPIPVVFQRYSNFEWLSAVKNVSVGLAHVKDPHARELEARSRLADVGLSGAEAKYVRQLSGGMQQRLAFARAMAQRSEVVLLDEPFAAVDRETRDGLVTTLKSLLRLHPRTVLLVTHSPEDARALADRVVELPRLIAGTAPRLTLS